MGITFREIRQYVARNLKLSICFHDGHYDNYLLRSDIPEGKYDDLYVYGVGMIDVEFPRDVYAEFDPEEMTRVSEIELVCGLEIVVQETPREITRKQEKGLIFGDLKYYLQRFGNFAIVMKEDWASEKYELLRDIPDKYDDLFVYGIGIEDNPDEMRKNKNDFFDMSLMKRMVIVLSQTPRNFS